MQRNQLKAVTKDELIESIMSFQDGDALQTVTTKLDMLVNQVADLKKTIESTNNTVHEKISALQSQVDKQAYIIARQQRSLESIDRKDRECSLVITGVPDEHESLEGAKFDIEKIVKIWEKVSVSADVRGARRLGNRNSNGTTTDSRPWRRPILLTVTSKCEGDAILEEIKKLKTSGDTYNKIYIKKDVHPSIRAEWKRIRDAEKNEKELPENVGCNIYLNTRERQLYKDGEVIDKWNLVGF